MSKIKEADMPEIPSFEFSALGSTDDVQVQELQQEMVRVFRSHGCVLLSELFPKGWVEDLAIGFRRRYRRYFVPGVFHEDALRVGRDRWMVSLKLAGRFAQEELLAPSLLMPVFRSLLGEELILNSAGVVVSLPGAAAQHEHRDLPALFEDHPIDAQMPCFALTLMIPLLDCHELHGTTMLRVGSHRVPEAEAEEMEESYPEVPVGSALLVDYRLHHGGTPNRSSRARPLLYMVYSRPWLRDYRNFKKQPPLQIPWRIYRRLDPALQGLLSTAALTWW